MRLLMPLANWICLVVLAIPTSASAQNPASGEPGLTSPPNTLFAQCGENSTAQNVFSPIAVSPDGRGRAYVELQMTGKQCAHKSKLFVSTDDSPFRLVYFIAPERYALGNGMAVLGWSQTSNMVLVRIERWQEGSDAPDDEQLMAVNAADGVVNTPDLSGLLSSRKDRQCSFRILDAGFSADKFPVLLVRAHFATFHEEGDDADVPVDKQCSPATETWKVFDDGNARRVDDGTPLRLYRKFLPNPRTRH